MVPLTDAQYLSTVHRHTDCQSYSPRICAGSMFRRGCLVDMDAKVDQVARLVAGS